MSEQKRCRQHGYYTDDICPGCLKAAAPALLKALHQIYECGSIKKAKQIAKQAIALAKN